MKPINPERLKARLAEYRDLDAVPRHQRQNLALRYENLAFRIETYEDDLSELNTGETIQDRQYAHLHRMAERALAESEDVIAKKELFEESIQDRFISQVDNGMSSQINGSEAYYIERATLLLAQAGEPIQTPPKGKVALLWLGKSLAGLVTGLSIDKLINPDGAYDLRFIAIGLGMAFSVIALSQIERLAFKHRLDAQKRYVYAALAIGALLLTTEAALNYEGIITTTADLISMANASESWSEDGAATVTEAAPKSRSLLLFAVSFLSICMFVMALSGRDSAFRYLEQQRLNSKIAKLKKDKKEQIEAYFFEFPEHFKRVSTAFPDSPKKLEAGTVRSLANWEARQARAKQKRLAQLASDGERLQADIQDYAAAVVAARSVPQNIPFAS